MSNNSDLQIYRPSRNSVRGKHIEETVKSYKLNKQITKEKERFSEETKKRRKINARISELIIQGWPEEEIQTAIEREFPDENPSRIKKLIEHWSSQCKKAIYEIDSIVQRLANGEITKRLADNGKMRVCKHYQSLTPKIESYYNSKVSEMEEER